MSQQSAIDKAMALIDAANDADPNRETADGTEWPKELLYSRRMSDMLQRYAPAADDAVRLAVRAQHVLGCSDGAELHGFAVAVGPNASYKSGPPLARSSASCF